MLVSNSRELVISSLMTIYLLFCKSKAKYHMLCSHLLGRPQARGKAFPTRGGVSGGGLGEQPATVTPFIKVFNL